MDDNGGSEIEIQWRFLISWTHLMIDKTFHGRDIADNFWAV